VTGHPPARPPALNPLPRLSAPTFAELEISARLLPCGFIPGRIFAAWYALHALAATLALVPREEPGRWVVKHVRTGMYLTVPTEYMGVWKARWACGLSSARRFFSRSEAESTCNRVYDERVVRLRARAARREEVKSDADVSLRLAQDTYDQLEACRARVVALEADRKYWRDRAGEE
jgi:hypothetical protein